MTTTTNFGWTLPTVGSDGNLWGGYLNGNLTKQDSLLRYAFNSFASNTAPVAPTTPQQGMLWLNTTANPNLFNIYDGRNWVEIGALDTQGHVFVPSSPSVTVGDYKYSVQTATGGGWSLCDGSAISRADYSALFNIFEALSPSLPFGAGNGVDTFNLPDMRGMVAGGVGTNAGTSTITPTIPWTVPTAKTMGQYTGEEAHTLTIPEIPSHNHPPLAADQTNFIGSGTTQPRYSPTTTNGLGISATTGNTGGGGSHNTIQPTGYFGSYFIYTGVFP